MTDTITLSSYEMDRLKMILRIEEDELSVAEAAESLQLSERQLYRIIKRYRAEGDAGLCHRLRGRASNKAFPSEVRMQSVRLYREQYSDYGPTLFSEKLAVYHNIQIWQTSSVSNTSATPTTIGPLPFMRSSFNC